MAEDGDGAAGDIERELMSALKALRVICMAQDDLLACYRLGHGRTPEKALNKLAYRDEVLRRVDAALAKGVDRG